MESRGWLSLQHDHALALQLSHQRFHVGQRFGEGHFVAVGQALCQCLHIDGNSLPLQLFDDEGCRVVQHQHFGEVDLFSVAYQHFFVGNGPYKEITFYMRFHCRVIGKKRLCQDGFPTHWRRMSSEFLFFSDLCDMPSASPCLCWIFPFRHNLFLSIIIQKNVCNLSSSEGLADDFRVFQRERAHAACASGRIGCGVSACVLPCALELPDVHQQAVDVETVVCRNGSTSHVHFRLQCAGVVQQPFVRRLSAARPVLYPDVDVGFSVGDGGEELVAGSCVVAKALEHDVRAVIVVPVGEWQVFVCILTPLFEKVGVAGGVVTAFPVACGLLTAQVILVGKCRAADDNLDVPRGRLRPHDLCKFIVCQAGVSALFFVQRPQFFSVIEQSHQVEGSASAVYDYRTAVGQVRDEKYKMKASRH